MFDWGHRQILIRNMHSCVVGPVYMSEALSKGSGLGCCSITKSSPTLCNDPMGCSTSGFLVLHCLLEFAQVYVH